MTWYLWALIGVLIFNVVMVLFMMAAHDYDDEYQKILDKEQLKAIKKTSITNKKS